MSLAEDFHRLFSGLERSSGRYVIPAGAQAGPEGKLHDKKWAWTTQDPVTTAVWEQHLKGELGVGIVPICDDATVKFGAIDVDVYPLDLKALVQEVKRLNLPLVPCRTKSGGAHLYLFLKEPASAELVRGKLMEWAVALGYPGVEVFPKQTRLASENDLGSWINIPYQAGARSMRYALNLKDASALSPEEFIKIADKTALTEAALSALQLPKDEAYGDLLLEAPPCQQTLAKRGWGDWQNNGMFNLCVYLRKRYGDMWESHADEYNRRFMQPPLSHSDLAAVVKSVRKKNYSYMCKQEPICGHCNKQICQTREFGIGGSTDDPGVVFGEIVILETDPPTWIWSVDAARLECTSEDILDQRRFQRLAMEKLQKITYTVKPNVWLDIVRPRVARAERIGVPEDASKQGQFWVHLQRFCTSRVRGRSLDELLLGKPFTDDSTARTYFCSADLFQYLTQHRFNGITEKDVFKWLRHKGVEHHSGSLKGKFVNYWSVPAFSEQTQEHDPVRPKPQEKM